ERLLLERNIIAGLPGGEGSYDRQGIRRAIAEFISLGTEGMRANLVAFLEDVIPVAEEAGVRMCIHPDDPPFSLFGLPRVVSTADDARAIMNAVPSLSNGLTLCAGSFGARADNDLVGIAREFGPQIHFVHLRNIRREPDGSFYESEHLDGDNDIVGLVDALLDEEERRTAQGRTDRIAMRPDHGHLLGDEIGQAGVNPGYSYGGRLKGLAELRGVMHALQAVRRR
ncbi:MAG: mannonate dehydratase, partial [Gammaproteobacteria bacterium]|nr:mannonate dehydratase [Gammaproteobacteria bacterium]